ncbi:MAG: ABC transporter permease [Eubacteriales bacterium]|nr:ABC transporter permease [Eubacteriales bacterium]
MEQTQKRKTNWLVENYRTKPLFSTACALLVMVVLQTIALGFDYPSVGDWFAAWGKNWINILRNNAGVGIIALGMAFVIISGGIDLAVGSTLVAIGAVIMVLIDQNGGLSLIGITGVPAFIIAIAAGVGVGFLLGQCTGFLVTKSKIPPFIATLGMMKICRSVTQQCMQTISPSVPKAFLAISNTRVGGEIILPILYWLIIAVVLHVVSKHTAFGRQVFAVGSSERTSKLSGVNVSRVKRRVYVLMGMLVAVTATIQIARIGSMDYANAGSGYEMDAIAAVIVGGTSMSGGKGSIFGAVLGMLIIAVMNNLLNLLGVPPFLREAFKGFIVIGAVMLQKKESAS